MRHDPPTHRWIEAEPRRPAPRELRATADGGATADGEATADDGATADGGAAAGTEAAADGERARLLVLVQESFALPADVSVTPAGRGAQTEVWQVRTGRQTYALRRVLAGDPPHPAAVETQVALAARRPGGRPADPWFDRPPDRQHWRRVVDAATAAGTSWSARLAAVQCELPALHAVVAPPDPDRLRLCHGPGRVRTPADFSMLIATHLNFLHRQVRVALDPAAPPGERRWADLEIDEGLRTLPSPGVLSAVLDALRRAAPPGDQD